LGVEMGIARTIGAIVFSVVIGLIMAFIFRKEEKAKKEEQMNFPDVPEKRPMSQTTFHFMTLVAILVFANWGSPSAGDTTSFWYYVFSYKWFITGAFALMLCYSLIKILKIKWQWVLSAALATISSAFIAMTF